MITNEPYCKVLPVCSLNLTCQCLYYPVQHLIFSDYMRWHRAVCDIGDYGLMMNNVFLYAAILCI